LTCNNLHLFKVLHLINFDLCLPVKLLWPSLDGLAEKFDEELCFLFLNLIHFNIRGNVTELLGCLNKNIYFYFVTLVSLENM
jgi:hypothetical protein